MMDPRFRLKVQAVKHKRRLINVRRRFSVEYLEVLKLRYTCRTCGHSAIFDRSGFSVEVLRKLADYQNQGGGASGVCPRCTKQKRDELHPMPKEAQ